MTTCLQGHWENSGLEEGDMVLIHSSMRRTFRKILEMGEVPSSEIVIKSLLDLLGPQGTLIFPTFNFDFPESRFFSILNTRSQMGKVTEDARVLYPGVRTGHPIYSFKVIGKKQKEFEGINNESGYGPDSPFARLVDLDGKIAVVDLDDQNSMTFYHYVEESCQVDYRYFKTFNGMYENQSGEISEVEYKLFVRKIQDGVVTDVNQMGELLWHEGLYSGNRPGEGNGLRSIRAKALFDRTSAEIRAGNALGNLYSIQLPD
jgi:aminoglycoside 3-N-acetyltransferase